MVVPHTTFTFDLFIVTHLAMFLIGLTGGISTGKSTVSRLFADLHCPIVDADLIAREGENI